MILPAQTPLLVPARSDALPPPNLSEKEQAMYDLVLAHFSNPDYVLPDVDDGEDGMLAEVERMWLSYECILRYIHTTGHNVPAIIKRLEATLKWRRDFGLYTRLTPSLVESDAVNGQEFICGYDTQGRPALYCYPSRRPTEDGSRYLRFVVWFYERTIELMGPGIESVTVMMDYADKPSIPSFSTCSQVIHVFQTHYPKLLGVCVIMHFPSLLHAFWNLLTPLMNTDTRSKLIFNPVLDDNGLWRSVEARDQGRDDAKLFDRDQLLRDGWEGKMPFTYEHGTYWPALLAMSEARRNDMMRVWRKLGGVVGIREWDVKIGVRDGLTVPSNGVDDVL